MFDMRNNTGNKNVLDRSYIRYVRLLSSIMELKWRGELKAGVLTRNLPNTVFETNL